MTITRRTALGFLGAVALPSSAVVAVSAATVPKKLSIDALLTKATPVERISFHADALADVMAEVHPGKIFRVQIDHDLAFCFITARTSEIAI